MSYTCSVIIAILIALLGGIWLHKAVTSYSQKKMAQRREDLYKRVRIIDDDSSDSEEEWAAIDRFMATDELSNIRH